MLWKVLVHHEECIEEEKEDTLESGCEEVLGHSCRREGVSKAQSAVQQRSMQDIQKRIQAGRRAGQRKAAGGFTTESMGGICSLLMC